MTSFSDLFNRHFQESFLAHLVRDSGFLEAVSQDVRPELFPDETMSRMVRIVLDYHRSNKTAPEILIFQVLDNDLGNKILTEAHHKLLVSLADDLFAQQLQNRAFILENFSNFCRVQKYRADLPVIHQLLEKGNIAAADQVLAGIISYRTGQAVKLGRDYSVQSAIDRTERRREQDAKRLFTFIPELDQIVPGIGEGNVNMVQSRQSSDGKTALLTHLARSFAFQNANVLLVTVGDMTEEEYEDRLDMCFAGLTRQELANDLSVFEAQQRLAKFRGKIHIKEFPASVTTLNTLKNYCEILEASKSFVPDVLVLDYADCLGPSTRELRAKPYQGQAEVFTELKGWMQETGMRCWTAGQSNRQASEESFSEQRHVAGSIEKVRTCDSIISIQRDTAEETVIKVIKTRHSGGIGQVFSIPTDFSRMQFYNSRARREM
jgi:replicative DNA helicase